MGDAPCTFGVRMPLEISMLNERIQREVQHTKIFKTYQPNFTIAPLTSKFYAKHDQLDNENEEKQLQKKTEEYFKGIKKNKLQGPKSFNDHAITGNQEYGWYKAPFSGYDKQDERLFHPVLESDYTRHEVMVMIEMAKMRNQT